MWEEMDFNMLSYVSWRVSIGKMNNECWAHRVRYRKMFCSHEAPEQQEGESEEVT